MYIIFKKCCFFLTKRKIDVTLPLIWKRERHSAAFVQGNRVEIPNCSCSCNPLFNELTPSVTGKPGRPSGSMEKSEDLPIQGHKMSCCHPRRLGLEDISYFKPLFFKEREETADTHRCDGHMYCIRYGTTGEEGHSARGCGDSHRYGAFAEERACADRNHLQKDAGCVCRQIH